MTYDPKNRPTYLGFDHDRTNPNRLKTGVMSVSDDKQNEIAPIPQPPSALAQIMHVSKIGAVILALLASAVLGAQESGIVLPAALLAAAKVIIGLASALGITSAGLSKAKAGEPADTLK